jgi:hypothetical protein
MATAAAHKSTTAHPGGMPIAAQINPTPPKLVESNTVATQFVQQYYHVLSNCPENLHRFYTDASTLSHSVVGEETVHTQTQRAIHEKVLGLGLQGAVPQILSVVSQNSIGGGVVVHTTGFLTLEGTKPRPFAQVFFLAQQDPNGYYVLNDLFCWMQKEERIVVEAEQPSKPAVPAPAPKQVTQQQAEGKKSVSGVSAAGTLAEEANVKSTNESVRAEAVRAQAPAAAPQQQVKEATTETEMPTPEIDVDAPMTYAQRLKMAAAKAPQQEAATSEEGASPTPTEENSKESPEGSMQPGDDIDSCSIFVRNLPPSITDEALLAEFSKLGQVEGGLKGISLKNLQKGNPYAFVHFRSPQVAARVLGAKIEIDGKQLEIAGKKPSIINRSKKVQSNGGGRGGAKRGSGSQGANAGEGRVNSGGKFSGNRQKASNARGMGKINSNGRNQGSGKGQS